LFSSSSSTRLPEGHSENPDLRAEQKKDAEAFLKDR
jgi:hypothetical protein